MSHAAPPTDFSYDPFSREAMSNPMPLYRILRDHFPVYRLEKYDGYAFSRFEDVYELYQKDDYFHTMEGTLVSGVDIAGKPRLQEVPEWTRNPLPMLGLVQPPVYEEIRQAMGKALRPRSVAAIEEDVRTRTRQLLEALLPRGQFDFVKDFAGIIAAGTVCNMCGIPVERAAEVLRAVNFATQQDPVTGGFAPDWRKNRDVLVNICRESVVRRREAGANGDVPPIDGLINYRIDGRALDDVEIATFISSIVLGGTETLPKVIAHGLMEIEKRPDQKRQIMADLDRNAASAVEEMFRLCGPAQWFMRTVKKPVTIAGQPLEVGHRVFALIQAANHDEREFENPDDFVWNRQITRHLGFGHGLHFCIGIHLARMEGRVLLSEFLSRVPDYRTIEAERLPSSFQWGFGSVTMDVSSAMERV